MDFVTKSFLKDETLTSWTLLQHICPHFWAWLLLYSAITPKGEDKYVVNVFNWSEVHLSEMNCYKIYTLETWPQLIKSFMFRYLNVPMTSSLGRSSNLRRGTSWRFIFLDFAIFLKFPSLLVFAFLDFFDFGIILKLFLNLRAYFRSLKSVSVCLDISRDIKLYQHHQHALEDSCLCAGPGYST